MTAKPQPAGSWFGDGVPSSPLLCRFPSYLRGDTPSSVVHFVMHSPSSGLASPTPALDSGPSSISWATEGMLSHGGQTLRDGRAAKGAEKCHAPQLTRQSRHPALDPLS